MEEINKKEKQTSMNENLSQMLTETTPTEEVVFSEDSLPIEDVGETNDVLQVETQVVPEATPQVDITLSNMMDWMDLNVSNLENVNQVKVAIRGIDSASTLIVAIKDGSGEVDSQGNEKRKLHVFDGANELPVLALNGVGMEIYNNGTQIVHQLNESIFIKSYSVRTGLICVHSILVDGKLLPFATTKVKRADAGLDLIGSPDSDVIRTKLAATADMESIQLLYKQITKAEGLTTNQDVVNWLLARQATITDVNHHLQIDNVIISILA